MHQLVQELWQRNIEISLLLLAVFFARQSLRYANDHKNTYLLWMSIPIGLLTAWLLRLVEFTKPPVESLSNFVQSYVVRPYIQEPVKAPDEWALMGYVWLLVAALLLVRLAFQHSQLRVELDSIRSANKATHILNAVSNYPVVAIRKTDFSPAAYGFFKPKIYFPMHLESELSREQIELIITHEEHHIQQGHLWLNLVWDVTVCIIWFNPLLYLARKYFRHDQELFCDHLVLHKANTGAHNAYGHALLSTVSATHSVSLLCPWKSIHHLEERIMNIKKLNQFSNKSLLMAFAGIIACTSLYSVSAHEADTHKQKRIYKVMHKDGAEKHHVREIKMIKDSKTYVEKNGEKYILEGDTKRDMSAEELAIYERETQEVHAHKMMRDATPMGKHNKGHKQIKIIRTHEAGELSDEEIEMMTHEVKNMQVEMELHKDEFAMAQHEIQMAKNELEAARKENQLTRPQAEKARRQLEKSAKKLAHNQERLQKSMQQARAEIERMREEILQSKAR